MSGTNFLGSLPVGDVGYFGVDWSRQRAAVAGDALDGTPTIVCASADLTIANATMIGDVLMFNAGSAVGAGYRLTARAKFLPSRREVSQVVTLIVGDEGGAEPLTLDEARLHLNLDASGTPPQHPHDSLVLDLIAAARSHIELETGVDLIERKRTHVRDGWPYAHENAVEWSTWGRSNYGVPRLREPGRFCGGGVSFLLPYTPIRSIVQIRYRDTDGVWQVLAADQWESSLDGVLTRINAPIGISWPSTAMLHDAVQVDCLTGGSIDPSLKTAVRSLLAVYYENRGPTGIVPGLSDILDKFRTYA